MGLADHIIKPTDVGGDRFHIGKDLNGNFVFTVNSQSAKLSPAMAEDLACRILRALGHRVEVSDAAPGPAFDA